MIVTSSERSATDPCVVRIADIIGSDVAMSPDDGERVRAVIEEAIGSASESDGAVVLSFAGLSIVTTSFLNSAVGALYGSHDNELLGRTLSAPDASPQDKELLQRVVKTAKQYYADPIRFRTVVDSVLEED